MNKFQLIDILITKVDTMADAHGVNRCVMTIDIIQQLNALKEQLQKEDAHADDHAE